MASEFSRLVIDRDQAAKDYDEALAQRGRTQARIDEIQRHLTALPRLATFAASERNWSRFSPCRTPALRRVKTTT